MTCIDSVPRELNAEEQATLDAPQERLENLGNEAEQDDPPEERLQEIASLETRIEGLTEECFRPEDVVRAGAFVCLGPNGGIRIERGYVRPEDAPSDGDTTGEGDCQEACEAPEVIETKGLSAALVAELTAQRTMALRNDLAQAPELALIAVTHALAARAFYPFESLSCLGLSSTRHRSQAQLQVSIKPPPERLLTLGTRHGQRGCHPMVTHCGTSSPVSVWMT